MSVKKFKFVSPGVSVTEIDQSQVPQLPGAVGPVIIGTAERGPAMVPTTVASFAEFKEVFGEPVIGTEGADDVWRSSYQSTPSYGAYAAKAYLKSGSPITFVRLLGTESDGGYSPAAHGGLQRGLFVSGSSGLQLAAVFYGDVQIKSLGVGVTGSVTDNKIILTEAVSGKEVEVSLDESDAKYIRKVFNTDPTAGAWLGESFANAAPAAFTTVSMANIDLGSRQSAQVSPETGWVISQITDNADYTNLDNFDNLHLFKFASLHGAEWEQKNLKISIENIRVSTSDANPYGSFSVVVRSADDADSSPEVVERFSNLNLNPNSSNYIAKVIGDMRMYWDGSRLSARGEFVNNSKYIRVMMAPTAGSNPSSLPFGFVGPVKIADIDIDGNSGSFPTLPLRADNDDATLSSADQAYFGVKTTKGVGRTFNKDYVDYLTYAPSASQKSFVFTLDDLVDTAGTLVHTIGSHQASGSITAISGSEEVLSRDFAGFTMPLVGGFDGVDVTAKNPFSNTILGTTTAPAYKAVERAIASIQDPEVVEMNLAAIPGVWQPSLTRKLISVCEQRADSLAIIDIQDDYVPEWDGGEAYPNVTQAVAKMRDRAVDSSYGAAFFPWVRGYDEGKDRTIPMPPSVAMLGVMASSEKQSEVWFAPAGFTRGGLSANGAAGFPVVGVMHQLTSKERDSLYEYGVNPIASFPSEGIVVFGQKTLQLEQSALDRINVRRLMIHIKREISTIASTTLFDQNVKATWARFLAKAEPFLNSVKARFGLTDFELTLDETTTTAELIDRNIVYAKVKLKPARAIEHFAIDFFITSSGASFEDL